MITKHPQKLNAEILDLGHLRNLHPSKICMYTVHTIQVLTKFVNHNLYKLMHYHQKPIHTDVFTAT